MKDKPILVTGGIVLRALARRTGQPIPEEVHRIPVEDPVVCRL